VGYGFRLIPRDNGEYAPDVREEMEAYVRAHWTTAYQRTDGCFVLCDSAEYRDEIVAENSVDRIRDGYEHIAIRPHEVSIEVDVDVQQNRRIAEFLSWSMSKWPADLVSEFDQVMTVDEFLKTMLSGT
jgi:hypothetical protein